MAGTITTLVSRVVSKKFLLSKANVERAFS